MERDRDKERGEKDGRQDEGEKEREGHKEKVYKQNGWLYMYIDKCVCVCWKTISYV